MSFGSQHDKPTDSEIGRLRNGTRVPGHSEAAFPLSPTPGLVWLPTDPPRVAPPLMTAAETAILLRLNEDGRDIADAIKSLEYIVAQGRIRPCRVGRHNRFALTEACRFIEDQTSRYDDRPPDGAGDVEPQE
jgi:hypothetical protein